MIICDQRVSVPVNVGGGTAPDTFTFKNNYWLTQSRCPPVLPTAEIGGQHSVDTGEHRPKVIAAVQAKMGRGATAFLNLAEPLVPWPGNPWYWSSQGQPILLVGGSDDDNLFQWPAEKLIPQLDRIAAVGGNVIRNTMSDRQDRGFERYPFHRLDSGLYDLAQWDREYWKRVDTLLEETRKRRIYVQIEIWDRFDYTDKQGSNHWQKHPYHPKNNVNYSAEESGFADRYPEHPGQNKQPFFFTTPAQWNNQTVRRYQEAFVNKLLDHSLKFDHVLYCMDNETKAEPAWGKHWAELVKDRAAKANKTVMVTEMWDDWNLTSEEHRQTFDHPELYSYVDVSQNNHNRSDKHWDNFLFVRKYLAAHPRPMNTTKIYGADGNKFKHTDQEAIERFWRHLLAGAASVRFHRPPSGLGINDKAGRCIQAARRLESEISLWDVKAANDLLSDREENEAFLAADPGKTYALYFPARKVPGEVTLDLKPHRDTYTLRWIDIDKGTWLAEGGKEVVGGKPITLTSPSSANTVAVLALSNRKQESQ